MASQRRKFAPGSISSDDETQNLCSVEFFNAAFDRNRQAPGTKTPTRWPYHVEVAPLSVKAIVSRVEDSVRAILHKHSISIEDYGVFMIKRRVGSLAHAKAARATLIIRTEDDLTGTFGPSTWWLAATEIQHVLDNELARGKEYGGKIRVEIRNEDLMDQHRSSLVPTGSKHFQHLTKIRESVIDLVRNTCGLVNTISFVMRGNRGSESPNPTVLIGVPPGAVFDWLHVYNKAMEMVFLVSKDIEVEIIPDMVVSSVSREYAIDPPHVYFARNHLPPVARNGGSIGARGSVDAGTLGVWMYVHKPGQRRQVAFLTNYHVIRNGEKDANKLRENDENGIGMIGAAPASKIIVDYPAPYDCEATETFLKDDISKKDLGPSNVYQTLLDVIEKYRNYPGIGVVSHASGYRKMNRHGKSMDWAIIIFNGQNPGRNVLPDTDSGVVPNLYHPAGDPRNRAYRITSNQIVSGIATPIHEEWMMKNGRETGITVGEYNGIKTNVKWEETSVPYLTDEHAMVAGNRSDLVAAGGDSGSIVVNAEGKWVGMIHGVSAGIAYLALAEDIILDIKEKTGCIISLMD